MVRADRVRRLAPAAALLGWAAALAFAPGGCSVAHEAPALVGSDCASCHAADYTATTEPVHSDDRARYHQRCIDCHATESWKPALAGPHPEERFSILGTTHNYACLDCHSLARGGSSEKGADTDCVGCHTGAHSPEVAIGRHANIPSFEVEEYVPNEPPWCMECHDGGRGFGKDLPHPEATFPILGGVHAYECQECHDTTRGKVTERNTSCTGCHDDEAHSQAIEADNHRMVEAYVFDPNDPDFCLDCHAEVIPGVSQPKQAP